MEKSILLSPLMSNCAPDVRGMLTVVVESCVTAEALHVAIHVATAERLPSEED
jgi:hypothetical protein